MSGDMSACVCVDIGPVLVKPGPQTVLCFPNVLGVSACVATEKVHVILCLIVNTSPVLSLLKLPVSTRCCRHIKNFDLSHLKFPVTASSGAGSLVGMRWFFNDLQFLSAMSGGSGSTLLIRSLGLITSLWSSATHCLSGRLQGLCVTTMGGRLWPSLILYVNVSLLGVTRAFSEACFRDFMS